MTQGEDKKKPIDGEVLPPMKETENTEPQVLASPPLVGIGWFRTLARLKRIDRQWKAYGDALASVARAHDESANLAEAVIRNIRQLASFDDVPKILEMDRKAVDEEVAAQAHTFAAEKLKRQIEMEQLERDAGDHSIAKAQERVSLKQLQIQAIQADIELVKLRYEHGVINKEKRDKEFADIMSTLDDDVSPEAELEALYIAEFEKLVEQYEGEENIPTDALEHLKRLKLKLDALRDELEDFPDE